MIDQSASARLRRLTPAARLAMDPAARDLARLEHDPVRAARLFGPRASRVLLLAATIRDEPDMPRSRLEAIFDAWNSAPRERRMRHNKAREALWAGARSGGIRRSRLQHVDALIDSRRSFAWRDSTPHMLLADAACAEVARDWIGDVAADALVADYFDALQGSC